MERLVVDRVVEIVDSLLHVFERGEEHGVGETGAKERYAQSFIIVNHDSEMGQGGMAYHEAECDRSSQSSGP